jgi:GT2 family glycosyltransferase
VSSVDVIIPTFNGRDFLHSCLQAVQCQTFSDVRVIVVDDGSTDGTDKMVSTEFPGSDYLRLPGNQGFATACNAGIAAGSAEFVALLNNDAIPEPDWLENLVEGMTRHLEAGALASKILLADGSGRIHAAGDTFSWSGLPNSRGVWEQDEGQYDTEESVFSACAAAALYRREALDDAARINGDPFDTDFFMYCEDIDLGWRLRLLGWEIIYVPDSRVKHHLSATGGGALASYYVARNSFAVLMKNLPDEIKSTVWRRFLRHQLRQLAETIPHLREPAAQARLRGILAGPRFARKQRRKRRSIQQSARVSVQQITTHFTPLSQGLS